MVDEICRNNKRTITRQLEERDKKYSEYYTPSEINAIKDKLDRLEKEISILDEKLKKREKKNVKVFLNITSNKLENTDVINDALLEKIINYI